MERVSASFIRLVVYLRVALNPCSCATQILNWTYLGPKIRKASFTFTFYECKKAKPLSLFPHFLAVLKSSLNGTSNFECLGSIFKRHVINLVHFLDLQIFLIRTC